MKVSLRFALDNLFVTGASFLAVSAVAFSAETVVHRLEVTGDLHGSDTAAGRIAA